jgi:hypothetical protein
MTEYPNNPKLFEMFLIISKFQTATAETKFWTHIDPLLSRQKISVTHILNNSRLRTAFTIRRISLNIFQNHADLDI